MHVAVLGAGVAGVTSAYYLAAAGCEVTVIERAALPAAGTSHANGGQLSYSFTDALARPSFLPTIPRLLLGLDPAVRVSLRSRPPLAGWGLRFIAQCTAGRSRANTVAVLETALRSARLLHDLQAHTGVEFDWRAGGKLVLLPPGGSLTAVQEAVRLKKKHGCRTQMLNMAEAEAVEPALGGFTERYGAAIFSEHDAIGDARAFTVGLHDWLRTRGSVSFRFGATVRGLDIDGGRLRAVHTSQGSVAADAVVVCLGADSPTILQPAGIRSHIYPVRGYSLTLPRGERAPSISITDTRRRILFCPLGGRMRVSGFADFVGFDGQRDTRRTARLRQTAAQLAPETADYGSTEAQPWAGSRPMTPDGRPLVGATGVHGLFLNCGHGMLGWTLACATGADVARAVTGVTS